MEFDVVIVGAGPAGLAAAIRLKQLAEQAGRELSVCVIEKGSEVGAHILSGAVVDPIGLDRLIPDWREREDCPLKVPVTRTEHWFLSARGGFSMPHILLPPMMSNRGCYTGSLGNLCRWLAGIAESMGVEVYPGFAAAEVLYDDEGRVIGVATGDMGLSRRGEKKPTYEPGVELKARYTFLAEGVRGSLTKGLIKRFGLREGADPQTYAIGLKELWEIPPEKHREGLVIHTQGWPLDDVAGGGFIYHQENNQLAIGFVVALDYANPHLSPYDEFQRFKTHPRVRPMLEGGRRVAYGARAINEGGFQSIPKLVFPGGALIGCAAGFVNVPRIKGSHNAIITGMLAAEAAFDAIVADRAHDELVAYPEALKRSSVWKELKAVRNARPALERFGIWGGTLYAGIELWLHALGLGFLVPWTFHHRGEDHAHTGRAEDYEPIAYPKPDGEITFDKLSSVFLSNTNHEEDQPIHLQLKDPERPVKLNWPEYAAPEERYCPAGVYEIVGKEEGRPRLQINAQNCVHCKTCDIKDVTQNINWVVPEGGGGPNYPNM
ncbi:MAG: electron transfer flavoprotein-ubiquinone oxidoreductase [Alphaproteobacteria bacterium]|nr:MAG: electron transfer flavoprotein-ubiquinone oxidoreductase [Alphaproteobacteria bacterium]